MLRGQNSTYQRREDNSLRKLRDKRLARGKGGDYRGYAKQGPGEKECAPRPTFVSSLEHWDTASSHQGTKDFSILKTEQANSSYRGAEAIATMVLWPRKAQAEFIAFSTFFITLMLGTRYS